MTYRNMLVNLDVDAPIGPLCKLAIDPAMDAHVAGEELPVRWKVRG